MSKVFSELEKKIVNDLLALDRNDGLNVLNNLLVNYLPDNYYLSVNTENDVSLMLLTKDFKNVDLNDIEGKTFELLVTLFSLFEYLKSQRYIYFTGDYKLKSLGMVCDDEQYVPCNLIDNELKKPLFEYTQKRFFITESFKQFVGNGYKTDSDLKQVEELLYTRIALGVTFAGLLASIFIPLYSTTTVDIKNDVLQISPEKATTQYLEQISQENKQLIDDFSTKLELLSNDFYETKISIKKSNKEEIKEIRNSINKLEQKFNELSTSINANKT